MMHQLEDVEVLAHKLCGVALILLWLLLLLLLLAKLS